MTCEAPSARRRRRARLRLLAALLAVAACSSCAPRRAVVPLPPRPAPRAAPGYETRVDSLDAVDPAVLAGRRVAIDPGHGGFFRGALGVQGLAEAEVNLAVALELASLLEARGARVFLTRDRDRDFLTPADSALRVDLAERMRLANAFGPDLFISIHHNADAGGAHDRNETQTYYKLGDEGPSLDAAASIHRFLRRNLGIVRQRILPGNYFVLRNSDAPAVLTEAAFITNPDVEARLALAEKRRLEAEALYLGIAHYFGRLVPAIVEFAARAAPGAPVDTLFSGVGPVLEARLEGEFDGAELLLDGVPVPLTRVEGTLRWAPDLPLAPGRHRATLSARLAGAGAARPQALAFTVRRKPRTLRVSSFPAAVPAEGGLIGVRIEPLDSYGLPVSDSLAVRVRARCRCDSPRASRVTVKDGVGWAYLDVAPRPRRPAAERSVVGLAASIVAAPRTPLPHRRSPARPAGGAAGPPRDLVTRALAIPFATDGAPGSRTAFLRRMPEDTVLLAAPGTAGPRPRVSWVNADGFAVFPLDSSGVPIVPALPGYRPWALDSTAGPRALPLSWSALMGGALHGRRIVLDPEGGGDDTAGMGPSGTRAAFYNMDVARALEADLVAAGAEVRLARTGDYAASDVERVRISEAFHADRYLRIGHRAEPPRLGYYFSSAAGKLWAQRTAAELGRLGVRPPALAEDAQYAVQQTSCPSLFVSIARVDDPSDEQRMNAPGALRAEAYALLLGLAREWAAEAGIEAAVEPSEIASPRPLTDWPVDSLEVREADGRPLAGAPVRLGGALVLETDALGRVRFARTEAGPIEIDIEHPRLRRRTVLVESQPGVVLTGPRGE